MEEINTTNGYDPTLGKPLTEEDIDSLWTEETTSHILNVELFDGKIAGGHSAVALEKCYLKPVNVSLNDKERPFTIDYVAETDYLGYYIYYIRPALTINKCVKVNNTGKVTFLPEVCAKHVIDTRIIPIDEYFLTIKDALLGEIPVKKQDRYRICGTSKDGIPFTAHICPKDSKWQFLTVYPTLKEKEKSIEKGM